MQYVLPECWQLLLEKLTKEAKDYLLKIKEDYVNCMRILLIFRLFHKIIKESWFNKVNSHKVEVNSLDSGCYPAETSVSGYQKMVTPPLYEKLQKKPKSHSKFEHYILTDLI